jgi:hypothetical protein
MDAEVVGDRRSREREHLGDVRCVLKACAQRLEDRTDCAPVSSPGPTARLQPLDHALTLAQRISNAVSMAAGDTP